MKQAIILIMMVLLCMSVASATITHTLTAPSNLAEQTSTSMLFNWTVVSTDVNATPGMTTWLYLSDVNNDTSVLNTSALVTNATWRNVTVSGLSVGFYKWYLITNDTDGNTTTISRWFEVRDADEQDLYYWVNSDSSYTAMTLNRSSGDLNISGTFMTVGAATINSVFSVTGNSTLENLSVTNDAYIGDDMTVNSDLDVVGNFTGNQIYAEMWYHNNTGTEVNFAVNSTYYEIWFTNATHINGFNFQGGFNVSSNLTALVAGVYAVNYMASGDGQNNHIYHTSVFINGVNEENCDNEHKMAAGSDIITQPGTCIIDLSVNDAVSLRTADIGSTSTGNYYSGNIQLVRVGD